MKRSLLFIVAILILGLAYLQFAPKDNESASTQGSIASAQTPDDSKPKILLMTSLPIIWGEAASMENILSGKAEPAAIYRHWQKTYDIEAVDSFASLAGAGADLVILAQPRAMDPADIADFDRWIRVGGRALIFTDPMLSWPTGLPIGDSRRPLMTGLLSPLLDHWGLELRTPVGKAAGGAQMQFDGLSVETVGIGSLHNLEQRAAGQAACRFSKANLIAECSIAKGYVILVADADFLDERLWEDQGRPEIEKTSDAAQWIDIMISDLRIAG